MIRSNQDESADKATPETAPWSPSRRGFLLASAGAITGVGGAGLDAFYVAPRRVEITRQTLPMPGLSPDLSGLRIAHLSDIHIYDGLHAAARLTMELIGTAQPYIVFVTGDLAESTGQLPEVGAFLAGCRGRLATVVTIGNWEHEVGITPALLERTCSKAGVTFLLNQTLVVSSGPAQVALVGLDDPVKGKPDPAAALHGLPSGVVTLWGFHAPGYADRLRGAGLPEPDLMFAGHTHGGQIRPPFIPAFTPPGSGRFVAGWYRDAFAPLYVNRGIGVTTIRARFRCPPELAVFSLQRG